VKGEFDRMVAAGAIVVREPYAFDDVPDVTDAAAASPVTMSIATLADPDDNYFQLMSPMEPAAAG
jgi:hypothetical protein